MVALSRERESKRAYVCVHRQCESSDQATANSPSAAWCAAELASPPPQSEGTLHLLAAVGVCPIADASADHDKAEEKTDEKGNNVRSVHSDKCLFLLFGNLDQAN
eukprot:TRINITY_DN666_c0_g1_i1.p1 TRINITY_DN666_c0_g1~~TRINITY_DN666_c0_g1_i1.p1  ORF type:complete len:105 (+),score=8.11 TRINITY_DN666_c0_g1_i1:360-674(+)